MSEEESSRSAKRLKETKKSPTSFVTWNCNGFTSRAKWDRNQLERLLHETEYPDMICLQEARIKASSPQDRGIPMSSEYLGDVKEAIETIFKDYEPFWSLADNKYAGTLTLIHKRIDLLSHAQQPSHPVIAYSTDAAIDLLLQRFQLTRKQVGLAEEKQPEKKVPKQTSMKSFFAPKNNANNKVTNGPTCLSNNQKHQFEGRFQFFAFECMDVVQTYVPNNGTKEESFQRRREWDAQMLRFTKERLAILEHLHKNNATLQERPLLWCGDLNVAKEYLDGTHWKKKDDGSIYEWWTDEAECFVGGGPSKNNNDINKNPDNVGIPSFTQGERKRFCQILQEGDFVDVWRELYPDGVTDDRYTQWNMWDRPNYTWRGHLAKTGASYAAKYQGKGQRLDYFLLSPSRLIQSVSSCHILGYGEKREGLFCGSDHCASILSLKEGLK